MAQKKPENMSFEEAVTELEAIVNQLEQGELNLEQALKQFERGIHLTRSSQHKLQQAEQQVRQLIGRQDEEQLVPFTLDKEDN